MSRRRWGDPLAGNQGRRQARVSDLLRRQISTVIEERFRDQLPAMVTITEVRTSGDLRQAKVFASVLAEKQQQVVVIEQLNVWSQDIRFQVANRVLLKFMPTLEFLLDLTAERAQRIEELLHGSDSGEPNR
ncbi:MAG: 30S ribosome-binding factor RbfA [bacterium]